MTNFGPSGGSTDPLVPFLVALIKIMSLKTKMGKSSTIGCSIRVEQIIAFHTYFIIQVGQVFEMI